MGSLCMYVLRGRRGHFATGGGGPEDKSLLLRNFEPIAPHTLSEQESECARNPRASRGRAGEVTRSTQSPFSRLSLASSTSCTTTYAKVRGKEDVYLRRKLNCSLLVSWVRVFEREWEGRDVIRPRPLFKPLMQTNYSFFSLFYQPC